MSVVRDLFLLAMVLVGVLAGMLYFKVQSLIVFDEKTKCTAHGGIVVRSAQNDSVYACLKDHT